MVAVDELMGGIGGATQAVLEPRPKSWSVFALSFPVGLSPCDCWNFVSASTVEASHFPFGVAVYEPSFPNAC